MANYSNLINSIRAVIKQNGTNDITGQLMQDVLVTMTNTIGRFAAFAGTAMPSTNPNNPDQTVYYLTSIPGTYVNFGGIVVPPDRLVALHNISGSWEMVVVVTFSDGGTISIDPALDPDSVNPVENRAIYAALQNIAVKKYEHLITLHTEDSSTPTPYTTFTILMYADFSTAFISLETLLQTVLDDGNRYPVISCAVQGAPVVNAVNFYTSAGTPYVRQYRIYPTTPFTDAYTVPEQYITFISDFVREI